jgi:SAM-dependent methyltransferase
MPVCVNIGCGQTPTHGWLNYDNSWSIRLAKAPLRVRALRSLGLLSEAQQKFIFFAKEHNILWADASKRIPERDSSVDVLYSSHMIEHMEQKDVVIFLKEACRILKPGGVIRVAVPNIKYHVDNYLKDDDADAFIENTHLTRRKPKTLIQKAKYLIIGDRNHQWMYDGLSLCNLLSSVGFQEPKIMEPGTTIIEDSGELDLNERIPESVFAEATNPL